MSEYTYLRRQFLMNGREPPWTLFSHIYPNLSSRLRGFSNNNWTARDFDRVDHQQSRTEEKSDMNSASVFQSLAIYTAKVVIASVLFVSIVASAFNPIRFAGEVRTGAKAWVSESLVAHGFAYSVLIAKGDPEAAAEIARYLEYLREYKAAVAAWEAAAVIHTRSKQPLSQDEIAKNIDRLQSIDRH